MSVLLIGLSFSETAYPAARNQIIGVPKNAKIDFTKGETLVPAYCMEKGVPGFPSSSLQLPTTRGRVRIEFRDNSKGAIDIESQEAVSKGLVSFSGAPEDISYTATVRAHESVARLEFIEGTTLAQEEIKLSSGEWDQIHKQSKEILERVDPEKTRSENQKVVHLNRKLFIESQLPGENLRLFRTTDCDPATFIRTTYPRLRSQGDASLIRSPGGQYVLHDAGADASEMKQILDSIEPDKTGIKRIAVCITHADYDHYKGLVWLIEQQRVSNGLLNIEAILIGADAQQIAAYQGNERFSATFKKLLASIFSDYDLAASSGAYAKFLKHGTLKDSLDFSPSLFEDSIAVSIDDLRLSILQFPGGDHRHANNIITRYAYKQFSIADYSDAMPEHFRQMLSTPVELKIDSISQLIKMGTIQKEATEFRLGCLDSSPSELEGKVEIVIKQFPSADQPTARKLYNASKQLYEKANETPLLDPSKLSEVVKLRTQLGWKPFDTDSKFEQLRILAELVTEKPAPGKADGLRASLASVNEYLVKLKTERQQLAEASKNAESNLDSILNAGGEVTPKYTPFQTQIAKWPHHAWMPRTTKDRSIMKAWIKVYRPEILLVNVPFDPANPELWKAPRLRLREIEALVEECRTDELKQGRHLPTKVRSTEESGVRFEALLRFLDSQLLG